MLTLLRVHVHQHLQYTSKPQKYILTELLQLVHYQSTSFTHQYIYISSHDYTTVQLLYANNSTTSKPQKYILNCYKLYSKLEYILPSLINTFISHHMTTQFSYYDNHRTPHSSLKHYMYIQQRIAPDGTSNTSAHQKLQNTIHHHTIYVTALAALLFLAMCDEVQIIDYV